MSHPTATQRQSDNQVAVSVRGDVRGIAAKTVLRRAYALLDALELRGVELSIVLCDDPFIRGLNRDFRHKDRATDVLAFAADAGDDAPWHAGEMHLLGDVIISVETAKRQAERAGHTLRKECVFLLIHGVLHLLGHTHEADEDEALMDSETARLLALLVPGS